MTRDSVSDDAPLRLDIAAKLAFPDGSIGLSSLRREAKKGRLRVWRIAGKDMTTLSEIRKMMDRCLVQDCLPASGSDQPTKTARPHGLSSTTTAESAFRSAQDAALMRVNKLKASSKNTLPESTTRPQESGAVVPLRSR